MERKMSLQEIIDLEPCWLQEDREAGIARIKALFGRRKYATPKRIMAAAISSEDKLWLLLREPFFTDQQLALIAGDCAEAVLPIYEVEFPGDIRPHEAINTARRYARGGVGSDEMRVAVEAAAGAARSAAKANRAGGVVWAAKAAAWAAEAAAWADAGMAAQAAARSAAKAAAWAATWAAWADARDNQLRLLKKYL